MREPSEMTSRERKLYADAMIREGNIYFNQMEFEKAAEKYKKAVYWSRSNSLDEK